MLKNFAFFITFSVGVTSISITNTSKAFVVWNTMDSKCEKVIPNTPLDLPDTPPNAYVDGNGITHLLSADTSSRISLGPSLLQNIRNCTIVLNSTYSDDPSLYATDEFLDASYAFDNGTIYALLHNEYPGMNQHHCPAHVTYPYCWTVSMTLAVSHDWGYTWQHARPPPHHVVAMSPYKYTNSSNMTNAGWGDSSGIVRSPGDGYFYAVVHNRFPQGMQSNGSCVIRTRDLTDPSSWRGWSGTDFSVSFVSPYVAPYNPEKHVCAVLDLPNCVMMGVVYSTFLEKFVSSLACGTQDGGDGGLIFYYSTSDDMIHWKTPAELPKPPVFPGVHFYAYPKIMDAEAPSKGDRNFQTIGKNATFFFISVTHNFYTEGRQIYGVNITFEK